MILEQIAVTTALILSVVAMIPVVIVAWVGAYVFICDVLRMNMDVQYRPPQPIPPKVSPPRGGSGTAQPKTPKPDSGKGDVA